MAAAAGCQFAETRGLLALAPGLAAFATVSTA
jgi:hypothetical protein